MRLPKWVWAIIGIVIILVIIVVLKVGISGHIDKGGVGVNITQDLVH